jgi:hypothetical protein
MKTVPRAPHATDQVSLLAVAPLLWAVFDSDGLGAGSALGHVDCDGARYRVGLAGDDLEPYTFASLDEAASWFAEFASALKLGVDHDDR